MASSLYTKAKEHLLSGDINQISDNIKTVIVDSGNYTVNLTTDEFLSDVPVASRVATSANLTNKSVTAGAADADDVTFSSVTGNSAEYIIIYQDTGTEGTSLLIAYYDTATGLPITPNGGDITITQDNGTNKIFKL